MTDGTYRETRQAWGRIWAEADIGVEHATGEYARARAIRDRYLTAVPPGARVLEAGCGVGTELVALSKRGIRAIGVDYVVAALESARRGDAHLRLAAADVHALPFADETFDAYLSFGVLEHFEFGPAPALREAFRVLVPGGVLVVTVPAPNVIWRAVRWRNAHRRRDTEPGYFETAYSARALAGLVADAGFSTTRLDSVGHAFTLWGLGGPFRGAGHYETAPLADRLGQWFERWCPEALAFATLVVATKPGTTR